MSQQRFQSTRLLAMALLILLQTAQPSPRSQEIVPPDEPDAVDSLKKDPVAAQTSPYFIAKELFKLEYRDDHFMTLLQELRERSGLRLYFDVFDADGDGLIAEHEIKETMELFPCSNAKVCQQYVNGDPDGPTGISQLYHENRQMREKIFFFYFARALLQCFRQEECKHQITPRKMGELALRQELQTRYDVEIKSHYDRAPGQELFSSHDPQQKKNDTGMNDLFFARIKNEGSLWEGRAVPAPLRARCDIAEEDSSLTPAEFREKYVRPRIPVMVRNVTADWPARVAWSTAERLKEDYGDTTMFVGVRPPSMVGLSTLGSFLDDHMQGEEEKDGMAKRDDAVEPLSYLWDDAVLQTRFAGKTQRHPVEDTRPVPLVARLTEGITNSSQSLLTVTSYQFTAGPALTGSHFHKHASAFCVLVHGLKYWSFAGDGTRRIKEGRELVELGEEMPGKEYLKTLVARRGKQWWLSHTPGVQECMQRPGDFVWVPEDYYHHVVNIWPSAAVNAELDSPLPAGLYPRPPQGSAKSDTCPVAGGRCGTRRRRRRVPGK